MIGKTDHPFFGAILAFALLSGCQKQPAATEASEPAKSATQAQAPAPVAEAPLQDLLVNGVRVPGLALRHNMRQIAAAIGAPLERLPPEMRDKVRERAEANSVARELLRQHAEKLGLKADQKVVQERLQRLLGELPPGTDLGSLQQKLGMDQTRLQVEMQTDELIDQLVKQFAAQTKPTDEEIAAYYKEHADKYSTPEQISASHILLTVTADAPPEQVEKVKLQAQQIAEQARKADAAAFAELAVKNSQDPSAATNRGDLGFFEPKHMVPEFAAAAAALKPGEVSDPVRSSFGFHVIRGQGKKAAKTSTLAEVRGEIAERLETEKARSKVDGLVQELRGQARIEHVDAAKPSSAAEDSGKP